MFDLLESKVQLHERVEIIYVVDGYEAVFLDRDGDRRVCLAWGETILQALLTLQEREEVKNWM